MGLKRSTLGASWRSSSAPRFVAARCVIAATAAAPAPAPTAGAVAAARELIVVKGGAAMFEPVIPGVIETAKNSLVPNNPNLIARAQRRRRRSCARTMRARRPSSSTRWR